MSCFAGDEMFADSYPMREVEDGFFWEVDGKVICSAATLVVAGSYVAHHLLLLAIL